MLNHILQAGTNPSINSNNMKASADASTTAAVIIQNYVGTILTQADLSLPDILPELPEHQAKARDHATSWRDAIQPQMISTNTDIVSFSNNFDSYYDPLVKLAVKIQQNPSDTASINTFKLGVQQLQALVAQKQTATHTVVNSVGGSRPRLPKMPAISPVIFRRQRRH